jgi:outer membrane receptor protein involved in Fe transport
MSRRTVHVLAVFGLIFAVSLAASAQTTTGRLRGRVQDPDGVPMPGVTVTLTGATLAGPPLIVVSSETGEFRYPTLTPGFYNLVAEMDGFQTQTLENVSVSLGKTAAANFVLYAQFAEAVTVSSETPLVDVTSSSVGTNFSADLIADLPTNRNFYDLMQVSPGISTACEECDRTISFGSDLQSNAWYNDGIETTAPETGSVWVGANPDMIQEIQVMGVGAPAEFGNMLGAALNVVTKSGTNQFKGGANVFWYNDSLVDSDINFTESEQPEFVQVDDFVDFTATLGGPIKKDRMWFFAGFEYWRDGYAMPGTNPESVPGDYNDRYDLKFSGRINDKNLIEAKVAYNDWGSPAAGTEFIADSAAAGEVGDDTIWGLSWQSIFSDRTFMEVRYSGWKSNDDWQSTTGNTDPAFIDYSPPGGGPTTYSGGVWWPWNYETSTDQASVVISHFADDFLKGDHDFKFGIQANQGEAKTLIAPSATNTYYYRYTYDYDYYGTIYPYDYYYKVIGRPYYYGNEQDNLGVFVDDSWAVSDRLTLNLGLRFDHATAVIPSYPRFDTDGNKTGEMVPGTDPVFEWNNWSPRLGFAYNAGAQRNTVIRGSFGVYYNGNVGGNWNNPPPFAPQLDAFWSFSPDGPFDEPAWSWDAGASSVDPNLEAPRTLQYSLGFEQEFRNHYSFGAMVVYKDTTNNIGWQILDDGVFEDLPFTDPYNGREYITWDAVDGQFATAIKGNMPGYTSAGFLDDYWAEYKGLVLTFNRRFTDWWGLQASYTYSESIGMNPRPWSQYQNNPMYGNKRGSNPNQYFNVDGATLVGDRPNMFRVLANFELPWNMHASTNINLQDGRPYYRMISAPYAVDRSVQDRFVADNSLRHDFQYLVDFVIGKRFSIPGNGRLNLDLRIFNLLNNTATDWFETWLLDYPDDFYPNWWVKPRRIQLHLGIEW